MATRVKDRSAKARGFKLVSFEIDSDLWQAFRIHAIKQAKTSSAIIRELIEAEVKHRRTR